MITDLLFVGYQRKGAQMVSEVVVASDASLVSYTSFLMG